MFHRAFLSYSISWTDISDVDHASLFVLSHTYFATIHPHLIHNNFILCVL